MYQPEPQILAAVYIHAHSLGVCLFDSNKLQIHCAHILYFSYSDKNLLKDKLNLCTEVLTNQPKNHLFQPISKKVSQFRTDLKTESIIHMLKQLPFQNLNGIQNLDNYIRMMSEESDCKFKSLGMLLFHLFNNTAAFKRTCVYFDSIEYWVDSIFHNLQFTQTEVKFLQLTTQHIHPSLIRTTVNSAMGSSIIKIYDSFLRTKGAKRCLKRIFLNPTYQLKQIEDRQQTIQWMIRWMSDKNYYNKIFKKIYTVDAIVNRFQRDRIEEDDWRKIIKSLEGIVELRNSMSLDNPPKVVSKFLGKGYWSLLVKVLGHLNKVIQTTPLGIKDSFDPRLKQLKRMFSDMPRILSQITQQQLWSEEINLIFMPQIGYLVSVPHSVELSDLDSWQLKFTNFNGKFYSNGLTNELDEKYGDINSTIQDIEKSIFNELDQIVNEISDELVDVYWEVCQLECMWGVSQLSKNMAVPRMSGEELVVVNGWNLLLAKSAVENHAFSFYHEKGPKQRVFNSETNIVNTNYTNRCSILSGPNGAGKTIYMKQLATIIYLAHCGFCVPASFAEVPLTDRIVFAQSSASLYNEKTGFENELQSLGKIMNKNVLTSKSLVLIDELCLSQDYTIGLKILYACVNYLTDNGQSGFRKNRYLSRASDYFNIPLTLIITHLTQLMTNQLIEENYHVRYLTMDVSSDFSFLFKLKPGLVKSGYGIKSAQGFMSDPNFIESAYNFWKKLK